MEKKGISLIVLVITMIIMVVIAGIIIVTLKNSDIVEQAAASRTVHNENAALETVRGVILDYQVTHPNARMSANLKTELETQFNTTYPDKAKLIYDSITDSIDIAFAQEGNYYFNLDNKLKLETTSNVTYNIVQGVLKVYSEEHPNDEMSEQYKTGLAAKFNTVYPGKTNLTYDSTSNSINVEFTQGKTYLFNVDDTFKLTSNGMKQLISNNSEDGSTQTEVKPTYVYEPVNAIEGDESLWTTEEDTENPGCYIITKYTGTGDKLNNVTIPNKIGDKKITKIGNGTGKVALFKGKITVANNLYLNTKAFYGCSGITEFEFEHSVVTAESDRASLSACNCTNLEKVVVGENCTIGSYTFASRSKMTNIEIGKYTSIGKQAFYYCINLNNILLGNNISIGEKAFASCSGLTEITIPLGTTSIGASAFDACRKLKKVIIPVGVTSVGQSAFNSCTSLEEITLPASITSIADHTFHGCNILKKATIPAGVTSIGQSAFYGCNSLEEITLPVGITSIADCTFDGCESLTEINIPSSVTSIGQNAFHGCNSLEEITVPDNVTISNQAFSICHGLKQINIGRNVTMIGNAFDLNTETVRKVNISSKTVENIDWSNNVIMSNTQLTVNLDLSDSTETIISTKKFLNQKQIVKIILSNNIQTIDTQAFNGCTGLTEINIPSSVTSIGQNAFMFCSNLQSIIVGSDAVKTLVVNSGYTGTVIVDTSINS